MAHPTPKNSAAKVLALIFLDQDSILLIDYLPKGQTINTEYYLSLLMQLKDILKEKRHGKFTKRILFLHDNAPAHWALATQKKLACHCLHHPPYSPDFGPVGLPPVPGLKKIERSPFFIRRRGHCCCGDLVGWTTF